MSTATLHIGDVRDVMATMPDRSVDLVLTSPPFLALRSYLPADHPDKGREIGSEPTPAEFLDTLLHLTAEWGRLLSPWGSIAVELGDTFAGSGGAGGDYGKGGMRDGQETFLGSARMRSGAVDSPQDEIAAGVHRVQKEGYRSSIRNMDHKVQGVGPGWPLDKSLCFIPQLYGACLAYGRNLLTGEESPAGRWRVRNFVCWARPNPPVGALGDKWRPATSYVTVATRDPRRWFDLDAVRGNPEDVKDQRSRTTNGRSGDADPSEVLTAGYTQRVPSHPNGAPPLDWVDDREATWEPLIGMPTQPYPGAHYACVDADTEALTPFGWKRHDQLRDGDLIACVDPSGESWHFAPATVHRYAFDGELVAIDKRVTNQRLTPNHRVLMRTKKAPEPRVRRADELTDGCMVPTASEMEPGGVGPGEKAAALAGWFCAEGHTIRDRVLISQSESANPTHCETIRALLAALGVEHHEWRRERVTPAGNPSIEITWEIKGAVAEWLGPFHKNVPMSVVFGWSQADVRALFDAMIDGDGHRRPDGRMSFIQKDRAVAEAVQMLAVRLGYRSTLSPRAGGLWTVYISPSRWVDLRSGLNGRESAISTEHYVGTVWCPNTQTGFWLARRNGQPFVTGNTFPSELPRRLIECMAPREVCTTCGEPRRRITGAAEYVPSASYRGGALQEGMTRAGDERGNQWAAQDGTARASVVRSAPTLGWTTCDCPAPTYRPGVVLDPFAGSGTTLAVATGHGRQAIGIDLNPANEDLIRGRVGMFLEVVHHASADTCGIDGSHGEVA